MSKNITINEGNIAKVFTGVKKITTNKSGSSGSVDWVPEDEAINYVDLDELDVSENGTYTATQEGCQAFNKVTVNVEPDLTTKGIDANGTYNASDDGADGYDSVVVDVHPNVANATFKRNGIYHASDLGVDGYREVTVNVEGSGGGGGSISGTEVKGIAATNLMAGQTVHVYSRGSQGLEGISAVLEGAYNDGRPIVYDDQVYWLTMGSYRRKSYSNIQDEGHYKEILTFNSNISVSYPFLVFRKSSYYQIQIATLDNPEGILDEGNAEIFSDSNGNILLTNRGAYDRNLNKIISYPSAAYSWESWGQRIPIDSGRYWKGLVNIPNQYYSQPIGAIGSWQTINEFRLTFSPSEVEVKEVAHTSQRKFYLTQPLNSEEYDLYSISPTGSQSLVMHIAKSQYTISEMSPSGEYFILAAYDLTDTAEETLAYKIKNDGTYETIPWQTIMRSRIIPGEDGYFVGKEYYPFINDEGGKYIAGTGSKGASGQLGICKASVSAGSKATAIVLFS